MSLRYGNEEPWPPVPAALGQEDKAWREVEREKEWIERVKDMSGPQAALQRTISFGALTPHAFLQPKDSDGQGPANPWKSFLQTPGATLSATAADYFTHRSSAGGDDTNMDTHSIGTNDDDEEEYSSSARRSRSCSPLKPLRRKTSLVSLKNYPHGAPSSTTIRPIDDDYLQTALQNHSKHNSTNSSSTTLIDAPYHDDLSAPSQTGDAADDSDLDGEELSTQNSITFYQGFRALYPKLVAPPSNPASPSTNAFGHLFPQDEFKDDQHLPPSYQTSSAASDHDSIPASINNIARLFSDLLNERDEVLRESDKLENQRNAISDELRQIEDLLTDLMRRKHSLRTRLKRTVEKEETVNQVLEELDEKIGSIGDETLTFEHTVRSLKGRSTTAA
ncbi:hypothetical protein DFS34DRAFT_155403 [Phlyctochytrium arcticum]|nr:hypothetical protein DFS34DRAFT_155403 [Phlyctochytrium arcticum]